MIFSVHIPKTAGTSFRNALKERYGDRLALYYGANDPATHPLLRVSRNALAGRVPTLEQAGNALIEVDLLARRCFDPAMRDESGRDDLEWQ